LLRTALQTRQLLLHVTACPRVNEHLGSVALARSSLDDFDLERRCLGPGYGSESIFDGVDTSCPAAKQALMGAHFDHILYLLYVSCCGERRIRLERKRAVGSASPGGRPSRLE
jgi:hypothetical protein